MPERPDASSKPQILIDNLSNATIERLRGEGACVERVGQGEADVSWLSAAGARGQIVITRDKRNRRSPLEVSAIVEARVAHFCFRGKGVSGQLEADIIGQAFESIVSFATRHEWPFMATIGGSGRLRMARSCADLLKWTGLED